MSIVIEGVDIQQGFDAIASMLSKPLLSKIGTAKPKQGIVGKECIVKAVDSMEDAAAFTARKDNWLWVGTRILNEQFACITKSFGSDWYQKYTRRVTDLLWEKIPENIMPHIAGSGLKMIEGFEKAVTEKVRYDLLCIGTSHIYSAICPIPYYRDYIEPWYRAGYFPCNWKSAPRRSEEVSKLLEKAIVLVY